MAIAIVFLIGWTPGYAFLVISVANVHKIDATAKQKMDQICHLLQLFNAAAHPIILYMTSTVFSRDAVDFGAWIRKRLLRRQDSRYGNNTLTVGSSVVRHVYSSVSHIDCGETTV
jgi:hypothetical protein